MAYQTNERALIGLGRVMKGYCIGFILLMATQQIFAAVDEYVEQKDSVNPILSWMSQYQFYVNLLCIMGFIYSICHMMYFTRRIIRQERDGNQQLIEMAQSAEAANAAKTMFLANMSHEIRTPLNAIIGFSDILKYSELPVVEKEYAGIIARSAHSLLAIINDILDISKIESDAFDINNESFEIGTFLEQLIELYSVKADEKKIHLSYYVEQRIPDYIFGDSFRLQQVLSNLLSNALKFTPQKGSVSFKVLILEETPERVTLRFVVKDTGIGIDEERQKKIFEPFTQADGSITRQYGGTGLGLSISRKIVRAMDSQLELESQKNRGSTFSFDVSFNVDGSRCKVRRQQESYVIGLYPIRPKDSDMKKRLVAVLKDFGDVIEDLTQVRDQKPDFFIALEADHIYAETTTIQELYDDPIIIYANQSMNLSKEEAKLFAGVVREPFYPTKFQKLFNRLIVSNPMQQELEVHDYTFTGKLLVAEDNYTNQILMKVLLERLGVEAVFADNGLDAISKFKEDHYDMIMMDIHMPLLDGIRAMQDIRQIERAKGLQKTIMVALTADAIKGDKERYLAMGMDDYLSKPVSYYQLVGLFYRYLQVTHDTVESTSEKGRNHTGSGERNIVQQEIQPLETGDDNPVKIIRMEDYSYDRERAKRHMGVDEVTLDMLIENFSLTYRKDLERLQMYIDRKDTKAIKEQAHFIKGSAANLHMNPLVRTLELIERRALNQEHMKLQIDSFYKYVENLRKA